MRKIAGTASADKNKRLRELNAELKVLRAKLTLAKKREGKDDHISVKVKKNQSRFERIKKRGVADKAIGKYHLEIDITAKDGEVYVPVSIASGKKVAGFMYQIEGTAPGLIVTTEIKARGDEVSQVTLGTLLYAKIPAGKTATFRIQATIRGDFGKVYKIVITRLNYKLTLMDARYQQYLKEIHSGKIKFS